MSSNCPPQLHLTLPANTTSFKRSFEQFGFDLESPVGGTDAGGSGSNGSLGPNSGNDRSKRARSTNRFSDDEDSVESSRASTDAGSSETSVSGNEMDSDSLSGLSVTRPPAALGPTHLSFLSSLEPPRLPTPELQDIEMPDYPSAEEESSPTATLPSDHDEHYRISLERFNAFDSQISALRQSRSHSPPMPARTPTPPPTLPPLALSSMSEDQNTNTSSIPFLHPPTQPSPPLPESFYSFGFPLSSRSQRSGPSTSREGRQGDPRLLPHEFHASSSNTIEQQDPRSVLNYPSRASPSQARSDALDLHNASAPRIDFSAPIWPRLSDPRTNDTGYSSFRDRLDSALDVLRAPSPLVRDLDELRPSSRRTEEGRAPDLAHTRAQRPDDVEAFLEERNRASPDRHSSTSARGDSWATTPQPGSRLEAFRRSSRLSLPMNLWESDGFPVFDTDEEHPRPASSTSRDDGRSRMPQSTFLRGVDDWLDGGDDRSASLAPEWAWGSTEREAASSSGHAVSPSTSTRVHSGSGSRTSGNTNEWSSAWRTESPMERETDVLLTELSNFQNPTPTILSHPLERRAADEVSGRGNPGSATARSINQALLGPSESGYRVGVRDQGDETDPLRRTSIDRLTPFPYSSREPLDDNDLDPNNGEISESERTYRMSQRPSRSPVRLSRADPRLAQLNEAGQRTSDYSTPSGTRWSATRPSLSDSIPEGSSNTSSQRARPSLSSSSTSLVPPLHRIRSRLHGTRVGASNSLVAESAAEIRRRSARAELLERLANDIADRPAESTNEETDHTERFAHDFPPPSNSRHQTLFPQTVSPLMYSSHSSTASNPTGPSYPRNHAVDSPSDETDRTAHDVHTIPYRFPNARRSDISFEGTRMYNTRGSNLTPTSSNPTSANTTTSFERDEMFDSSLYRVRSPPVRTHRHTASWDPPSRPSEGNRAGGSSTTLTDNYSSSTSRGFFDSQSSTISDMAHTIANNIDDRRREHGFPVPSQTASHFASPSSPTRVPSSNRNGANQYLDVPSLPSPDFGGIFDPPSEILESDRSSRRAAESAPLGVNPQAARRPPLVSSNTFRSSRRSHSPEDRETAFASPPPMANSSGVSTYRNLDPSAYEPGPFRNTVQRLVELDQIRANLESFVDHLTPRHSDPPSIPPLSFEDDFSPFHSGGLSHQERSSNPSSSRGAYSSRMEHDRRIPSDSARQVHAQAPSHVHDVRPGNPYALRDRFYRRPSLPAATSRSSQDPGPQPYLSQRLRPSGNDTHTPARRGPVDMHSYLSRQARIEASRIEAPEQSPQPTSQGEVEGFSHAIEVLRHDGLSNMRSQQLITRFQRERSELERRRAAAAPTAWGSIDHGSRHSDPYSRFRHAQRRPGGTESHEPWAIWSSNRVVPDLQTTAPDHSRNQTSPSHSPTRETDTTNDRLAARARRVARFRLHHPDSIGPFYAGSGPVHDYLGASLRFGRRGRTFGDYVRDEDFDGSYESLLSLSSIMGDAKPRATPEHVIAGLDAGFYKDWATVESDKRCPICLDDYKPLDAVLKLTDCSHWLHKGCLEQWLRGASTCPVCRKTVKGSGGPHHHPHHHHNHHSHGNDSNEPGPSRRRDEGGDGGNGGVGGSGSGGGRGGTRVWPPPWRYGEF